MHEGSDKSIDLLNAFSEWCGLPIAVVDLQSHVVARSASCMKVDAAFPDMDTLQRFIADYGHVKVPTVSAAKDGKYFFVAPVSGPLDQLIISGSLSEPTSSAYLSSDTTRDMLHRFGSLSQLLGSLHRLGERERLELTERSALGRLAQAAAPSIGSALDWIRLSPVVLPDFPLLGFAAKDGDEEYVVIYGAGGFEPLKDRRFMIGEGKLGMVAATEKGGLWPSPEESAAETLLIEAGIEINHLFVFPVIRCGEVAGILFGGSRQEKLTAHPDTLNHTVSIFARIAGLLMQNELSDKRARSSLLRLSTLLDVSQLLLPDTADMRKLIYSLVDMALHIGRGTFACVLCHNTDSDSADKMLFVSRGMDADKIRTYSRELTGRYIASSDSRPAAKPEPLTPVMRSTSAMGRIIEVPLMPFGHWYGVLCLNVEADFEPNEAITFFHGFSIVASIALEKTKERFSRQDRAVRTLHKSMKHWNPEMYRSSTRLAEWAVGYAESIGASQTEWNVLRQAAWLSGYDPNLLEEEEIDPSVVRIVAAYRNPNLLQSDESVGMAAGRQGAVLQMLDRFLRHNEDPEVIRELPHGDPALKQSLLRYILQQQIVEQEIVVMPVGASPPPHPAHDKIGLLSALTSREHEVLEYIGQGLNNKQIAAQLFISEHTVKNHVTKIFQKLDITDRSQATAILYEWKFRHQAVRS